MKFYYINYMKFEFKWQTKKSNEKVFDVIMFSVFGLSIKHVYTTMMVMYTDSYCN